MTSGAAGMPAAALLGCRAAPRAPRVPLKLGDLRDPRVVLAIAGFLLIVVLQAAGDAARS